MVTAANVVMILANSGEHQMLEGTELVEKIR